MIDYNMGRWGLQFVFRWSGSVFPKACLIALPNAAFTVLLHHYLHQEYGSESLLNMTGLSDVWSGYTAVLSLLIVFRNNQAYTRFWEGATLMHQVRSEWFNAITTLFAFCNHSEDAQQSVQDFQHNLIRLVSFLYCSALQQVCDLGNDRLEVLGFEGLSEEGLSLLEMSNDRCEIIMLWLQRLIVDADESQTIKIAPPLLTRAYQELAVGMVNLNNARKIKEIPFPFPYAQLIACMLMVHWVTTPLIATEVMSSAVVAASASFFSTFVLWCLAFISMEIDQPFGEDANDLPLHEMQKDFNQSLVTLLHPMAQKVPTDSSGTGASPAPHIALRPVLNVARAQASETKLQRMRTIAGVRTGAAPSLRRSNALGAVTKADPARRESWPGSVGSGSESAGTGTGTDDRSPTVPQKDVSLEANVAEEAVGEIRPVWHSGTSRTTSSGGIEERAMDIGRDEDPAEPPAAGAVVLLGRTSADAEAVPEVEKQSSLWLSQVSDEPPVIPESMH